MKTYKILEVVTKVYGYDVIAENETDAIEKINTHFANTDHPHIARQSDYDDVVSRDYQCEGKIE